MSFWQNSTQKHEVSCEYETPKQNRMLEAALVYAKNGFKVFPCREGAKTPAIANGFKSASVDPEQIKKWWGQNPKYNIGMTPPTCVICVDIDVGKGKDGFKSLKNFELGDTLTQTTPSNGAHKLYQYDPNRFEIKNTTDINGLIGVDTRMSEKGYIMAAPSIFLPTPKEIEKGKCAGGYEWQDDFDIYNIEVLPDNLASAICVKRENRYVAPKDKEHDVLKLLSYISPDCSYNKWISLGMACNSIGHGQDWDTWSAGGSEYSPEETHKKLLSFQTCTSVTIATLYHYAIEGGYVPEKVKHEVVNELPKYVEKKKAKAAFDETELLELIDALPQVASDLCDEVRRCNPYNHPAIELSTALLALSAPLVRRFLTDNLNTPCLDVLVCAETGEGKELCGNILRMVTKLSKNSDLLGASRYSSVSALFHKLSTNGGVICFGDEEGLQRKASAQKADGYSSSVGAYIMELQGRKITLANDYGETIPDGMSIMGKKKEELDMLKKTIYKPMFHKGATTTLATLKETLTLTSLASGEFNRKIVIGAKPRTDLPAMKMPSVELPVSVAQWIVDINNRSRFEHDGEEDPQFETIKLPRDFDTYCMPIRKWQRDKKAELQETGLGGVVSRASEKTLRIALWYTMVNDPHATEITYMALDWAMAFIKWADGGTINMLGDSVIHDDLDPRTQKEMKVLNCIKTYYHDNKKPISNRDLMRKMHLNSNERDIILSSLGEKELIKPIMEGRKKYVMPLEEN